jgi:maltose O-acetyltransferase
MDTVRIKGFLYHELGGVDLPYFVVHLLAAPLPDYFGSGMRTRILRLAGFSIGPRSLFWGMPRIIGGPGLSKRLKIGSDTRISVGCFLDLYAQVTIGNRVSFGPQVMLLTGQHELGDEERRIGQLSPAPIRIGDGCWIGARTTILPGRTIGAGSIVGAGSVVTRDVPPNVMVGGVPARIIKEL